jgi:putative HD superfamily hydrolase of NAD metabolism
MISQQACELARKTLSAQRFYHSECVAEASGNLAEKYGVDVEQARIAGYLHDILKERDPEDLLQRLQGSDIIDFTQIEHSPPIWHAYAGGLYVKEELGLDDDIANAVMYHTAGRKGMSMLEKVVFIGDYISEDREFKGVPEVREIAEHSLEKACVAALRNSIVHLCKKQKHIDINSVYAFNDLIFDGSK